MGIDWPKVDPTKEELEYVHISGPGRYSVESNLNLGEKDFWKTINFNENRLAGNSGKRRDEF